ncbi:MAG: sugar nucleotide-binding protein, partial [Chloroflexi bacterium]|nr:sugar nucleotide-binding protein [Chloroflexota bacterium]
MRILLTGGSGQLGSELRKRWDKEGLSAPSSKELDITDSQRVLTFVAELHPDIVVHTAAYTDVDGCERDPDRALLVNALGTQYLALACQEIGAALLFVSTDYVFDGQQTEPYLEFDPPNPINTYGRSKQAGEQAVTSLLDRFYIVRSSWLYSRSERNFVHKVLALAREAHELPMV